MGRRTTIDDAAGVLPLIDRRYLRGDGCSWAGTTTSLRPTSCSWGRRRVVATTTAAAAAKSLPSTPTGGMAARRGGRRGGRGRASWQKNSNTPLCFWPMILIILSSPPSPPPPRNKRRGSVRRALFADSTNPGQPGRSVLDPAVGTKPTGTTTTLPPHSF